MAASYDELEPWYEHLYAVLHGLVRAELAPPPGSRRPRALDAGCGTGFQTAILLELGYETAGVDLSAGLLRVARTRCAGAQLVQGDVETLPWRDETVDLVVSCGSTLSFVPRPDRAVAEIARVLRPGGRVLLEVEHRWSLDLVWRLASSAVGDPLGYEVTPREAWRAFGRPIREGVWMDYPGYPKLRLFTRQELDRLLADAGLVRRAHLGPPRRHERHPVHGAPPSATGPGDRSALPAAADTGRDPRGDVRRPCPRQQSRRSRREARPLSATRGSAGRRPRPTRARAPAGTAP